MQQYSLHAQKHKHHTSETLKQSFSISPQSSIQLKSMDFLHNNMYVMPHTKQQQLKNEVKSPQTSRKCTDFIEYTRSLSKDYSNEQRNANKPKPTNTKRNYHNYASPNIQPPVKQRQHWGITLLSSPHLHVGHNFNFSHYKRLCNLKFLLLSTLLYLLLALPHTTYAVCRNVTARSCEAICSDVGLNCTLRALLLLPDDDTYLASMRSSMPALHLAEQYVRNNSLLPKQINFEWMTDDVKCDASYATFKAMDGISKSCAHVVFGPVCDYALAAVSRIAKYFNSNGTPVISVGGATDSFEVQKTTCADEFYMLLRSGLLSFKSLSVMTIEVLKRYNWSNPIAVYEPNSREDVVGEQTCFLMMKSFSAEMRNLNLTFAQYPLAPQLRNRTEELKREIGNKHSKASPKILGSFADVDDLLPEIYSIRSGLASPS
ncbi:uncharacterized protein [Eurosta solidaginis]|uniref:uncharacterized protein n=1 Tax=Eurosta solidaginis TaxID=178769 RepID=UPI003530D324